MIAEVYRGEKQDKVQIGDSFGRWTVVGAYITDKRNERKWLCRCECGRERYVLERSLLYGASLSCGCIRREDRASNRDLTGRRFGELTVVKPVRMEDRRFGVHWQCRCSCGNIADFTETALLSGRQQHCGCQTGKQPAWRDISGQRFDRLTALFPLKADARGSKIWRCRCDCGNEVDVPYNTLLYCNTRSCGCKKKEHDQILGDSISRIAGTSINHLRSKKVPVNSSTGVKGVYKNKGKYIARIVFQKKQYWLGAFDSLEEAADARHEAEQIINDQVVAFYEKWKRRAEADPEWAENNPVRIEVDRSGSGLNLILLPRM